MINRTASDTQQLSENTTAELKQKLLELTQDKDFQPLKQKVEYYQEQLEPIVAEFESAQSFF